MASRLQIFATNHGSLLSTRFECRSSCFLRFDSRDNSQGAQRFQLLAGHKGKERLNMSTLITIIFHDESTAFEMRGSLARMQKQYLLEMEDAVVVTRDLNGKTQLHQPVSLTGTGALSGGFWGMLIGLLFLNPFLGFAIGAGAGALSGKLHAVGLEDKVVKEIGAEFTPGSSALFVLLRRVTADKVLDGLKAFAGKGKVFQTSLNKDDEKALREVLETPSQSAA